MGFEKFNFGHSSLEKKYRKEEERKRKKEELMMTRREFLGLAGWTAATAGIFGTALWNIFENLADEKEEGEEEQDVEPETEEQRKIAEENIKSIGEILDFKKEKIELNLKTSEQIKNYWKEKYQNKPLADDFQNAYREMGAWQPYLEKIFEEENVPKKYLYLAIPESHWQTNAVSKAKAVGHYQFIRSTAKSYDLKIEKGVDERKDPLKSARACAKLLKDLHEATGDWDLTLSGYNGGYIWNYLKEAKEKGDQVSYEQFLKSLEKKINDTKKEIETNPRLSREQKEKNFQNQVAGFSENLVYPQKFDAVYELIEDGFVSDQKPPVEFETIKINQPKNKFKIYQVKKKDSLFKISKNFGLKIEEIKKENPSLKKNILKTEMKLNIPVEKVKPITLTSLTERKKLDLGRLQFLNPAIKKNEPIPDGYIVRV